VAVTTKTSRRASHIGGVAAVAYLSTAATVPAYQAAPPWAVGMRSLLRAVAIARSVIPAWR
jgi:hypothetical protein